MPTIVQRIETLETELAAMKVRIKDVQSDIVADRKQARTEEKRIELENLQTKQRLRRRKIM